MSTPPVSFLLTMYQQEAYIREAVRSVLAQDYQPLEIILSDDASRDATYEIAKEEVARYRGPHTVTLNRNPHNFGVEHARRLLELARGRLLVRGNGDDIARPDRTSRQVAAWYDRKASLVTCNAEMISADGTPLGLRSTEARSGWVVIDDLIQHGNMPTTVGCTFLVDRAVYDRFPKINRNAYPVLLDQIVPFRAALMDGVYYVAEPLLLYRQHDLSMSSLMADRTGDPDAYYETLCGQYVWAQLCRLDELEHFRRQGHDRPQLTQIRQKLELRIISLTGSWAGYRRDLLAKGQCLSWLDREALTRRVVNFDPPPEPKLAAASGR